MPELARSAYIRANQRSNNANKIWAILMVDLEKKGETAATQEVVAHSMSEQESLG